MKRRWLILIAAVALALAIALVSALPTAIKHALHTQGSLHPWLHLLGFAGLTALLLSVTRQRLLQIGLLLALMLFGYGTEARESRKDGWPIETGDVKTDAEGVLLGAAFAVVAQLRGRQKGRQQAPWRYRPASPMSRMPSNPPDDADPAA